MARRIIIVSELFYPDKAATAYIMTKIADRLSVDYKVEVICGDSSYEGASLLDKNGPKNYVIHRVKLGNHDKNKLFSRVVRFIIGSLKLSKKLYSISNRNDKVLIVTNPAPFLLLAALIKKIKSFDLTIVVHDVFPENAVAAGILKSSHSLVYRIMLPIFNMAYSSANRLVVIGRDMEKLFRNKLKKRTPPMYLIENWGDKCDFSQNETRTDEKIKLLFAGNIGRCQWLETFVQIFGKTNNQYIKLEFRGNGAVVPIINEIVSRNGYENIVVGSSYNRCDQFKILHDCDIALVTLCEGMYGLGVPSKSYNIMSAGKPILYVGDPGSEMALVIKEYDIGYVFSNSEEEKILEWLNNVTPEMRIEFIEKGDRARNLAITVFSEDSILSKYSSLFKNIM